MRFLLPLAASHKTVVAAVGSVLALGAAMATFAAQDTLPGRSADSIQQVEVEPSATPTDEAVIDPTATPTPQAEEESSPTPESEATPTSTPEADDDAGQRDVVGIPDDNPNHQPDDGDGVCEKGETEVKTTPSGKQVNVPCHAATPGPPGVNKPPKGDHGNGGPPDGEAEDDGEGENTEE